MSMAVIISCISEQEVVTASTQELASGMYHCLMVCKALSTGALQLQWFFWSNSTA